jgi:hypothetical protein
MKLIQAIGFANGMPCPHAGQYLESFDFDAHGGQGYGEFTPDPAKAKRFRDQAEAVLFWRLPSRVRPRRPDGKPNRPLTSLSVAIVDAP